MRETSDALAAKEMEVSALGTRVGDLTLELGSLRADKDASDAEASTTNARATALELELRCSARALAEAQEGFDAEVCRVACLTRAVTELKVRV
ncbi:unnamed protein product, partial [Laminaria digitata]